MNSRPWAIHFGDARRLSVAVSLLSKLSQGAFFCNHLTRAEPTKAHSEVNSRRSQSSRSVLRAPEGTCGDQSHNRALRDGRYPYRFPRHQDAEINRREFG